MKSVFSCYRRMAISRSNFNIFPKFLGRLVGNFARIFLGEDEYANFCTLKVISKNVRNLEQKIKCQLLKLALN